MNTSIFSHSRRQEIYKGLVELYSGADAIKHAQRGICYTIAYLLLNEEEQERTRKLYREFNVERYIDNHIYFKPFSEYLIKQLPELAKQAPPREDWAESFWFNQNDALSRLQVVTAALEENLLTNQ